MPIGPLPFIMEKNRGGKKYTSSSHSAYTVTILESRGSLSKKSRRSSLHHQPLAGCIRCKPPSQILLYVYDGSHTECDRVYALDCSQHTWHLGIATAGKPLSPRKRSTLCLSHSKCAPDQQHSLVSGFQITSSIDSFATTFLIPNSECQDFALQIDSVLQACSGHRIIRDNSELRFPTERSVEDDDT